MGVELESFAGNLLSSSGLFMWDCEQCASLCAAVWSLLRLIEHISHLEISFSAASFALPLFSLKKQRFKMLFYAFIQEFIL